MVSTKTLYFDESGFTGNNLLDKNQPIFTIASTDITPELAKEILYNSFPSYKGDEFKFQQIWKSKKHRKGLLEFSKQVQPLQKNIFFWITDKKFVALTKLVDFLIEPIIHRAGYDFYNKGYSWKYLNYIHFGLEQFSDPDLYDSIVHAYQKFSRNPSRTELRNLQHFFKNLSNSIHNENAIFLKQMATGAELFEEFYNLNKFKSTDEIQLTTMLGLITHWRQNHEEDFIVIHDASSNFSRNKSMWEKITNSSVPGQQHRLGDGSFVEFPLRIIKTESVDSKENYAVQFCDVLGGLANKISIPNPDIEQQSFLTEVLQAGIAELPFNGIRPQPIFPDNMVPEKLQGVDVVDQMVDIIKGS